MTLVAGFSFCGKQMFPIFLKLESRSCLVVGAGVIAEGKIQGKLRPTGIRPKFVEKFDAAGIHLPPNVFGSPF